MPFDLQAWQDCGDPPAMRQPHPYEIKTALAWLKQLLTVKAAVRGANPKKSVHWLSDAYVFSGHTGTFSWAWISWHEGVS